MKTLAADAKPALLGGTPVCSTSWPATNTIGPEEKAAVMEVLDTGVLSAFRAVPGADFLGGERVRGLERDWARHFGVKHAVSFNSLTSGLYAAVGAMGIGAGDEVIVSPFTMSASATCALVYGAIPVFADIDPMSYCLDPKSVRARITERTKAIVVVHQFGCPAELDGIMALAKEHGLKVIEDCAQAPGAKYKGKWAGTIGDIGGFSLNYHKTIHSGEGGIMVTDDDNFALRMQLIRNHGEVVVAGMPVNDITNTVGGNTRMTEIEAAIASEQLKKLERLTEPRTRLAAYLDKRLAGLPGIFPQKLSHPESRHVYYFYPMRFDEKAAGLPRDLFVRAVCAEGVELRSGYLRPIYMEPVYQQKKAFANGFPFSERFFRGKVSYAKGLCPATEAAYEKEIIFGKYCRWPLTESHMDQVVEAFRKVLENKSALLEKKA